MTTAGTGEPARHIPERIAEIYKTWTMQAGGLRLFHVALIIAATISSVCAAAGLGKNLLKSRGYPDVNPLSVVAAISISLTSAFELGSKANNVRNGWRMLHAGIMRYEEEPDFTIEELIGVYEKAES